MDYIFILILSSIYLMLPAYAANSMPVIANRLGILSGLAKPIDFNHKFFGKPIFGHSKTLRGFVVGTFCGIFLGFLQYFLYNFPFFKQLSLITYSLENSLTAGFALGFGALLGDLAKSFIKRRFGILSGKSWPIIDQIDYPIGALIMFSLFFYTLPFDFILTIILISALFSVGANIIAYKLGIKKVWW